MQEWDRVLQYAEPARSVRVIVIVVIVRAVIMPMRGPLTRVVIVVVGSGRSAERCGVQACVRLVIRRRSGRVIVIVGGACTIIMRKSVIMSRRRLSLSVTGALLGRRIVGMIVGGADRRCVVIVHLPFLPWAPDDAEIAIGCAKRTPILLAMIA